MCTRCKVVLNHTIVAMVGEKIVRVECSTCHGVHAYHPVKVSKGATAKPARAATTTPRKTKTDPDAADRAEWANLQLNMDASRAIPYDMTRAYRLMDLVSHPSFGLGVVQLVIAPNKIDVLFQDGKKRLRCG
jgi:hypothetical protein